MARLSSSSARSLSRRLRSAAVIGLIVGATGAFIPGGHAAHAAGMADVQPSDITSASSSAALRSGSYTLTFDGGSVTFTFGSTPTQIPTISPAGGPGVTHNQGFQLVAPGNYTESTNPAVLLSGSAFLDGGTDVCKPTNVNNLFNVGSDGSDGFILRLNCGSGGIITVDVLTGNGPANTNTSAATPELGSGELLATGLVPALGLLLYRRRRQRRAGK